MKVLLREDIEKLGQLGEIVEVKAGYARNYLLPRRLAVLVSRDNEALIARIKKRRAELEVARRRSFVEQADVLRGKSITIEAKVAEERALYGSVDSRQVAEAVTRDLGHETDPRDVLIDAPFKELGTYDVEIRLHPEVTTTIKLWVVGESE